MAAADEKGAKDHGLEHSNTMAENLLSVTSSITMKMQGPAAMNEAQWKKCNCLPSISAVAKGVVEWAQEVSSEDEQMRVMTNMSPVWYNWVFRTQTLLRVLFQEYQNQLKKNGANAWSLMQHKNNLTTAKRAANAILEDLRGSNNLHSVLNRYYHVYLADSRHKPYKEFHKDKMWMEFSEMQYAILEILKLICLVLFIAFPPKKEFADQSGYIGKKCFSGFEDEDHGCKWALEELPSANVLRGEMEVSDKVDPVFVINEVFVEKSDDLLVGLLLYYGAHQWAQGISDDDWADKFVNERIQGTCVTCIQGVISILEQQENLAVNMNGKVQSFVLGVAVTFFNFIIAWLFKQPQAS